MASKSLIAKKPREQAGSVASRAFDFQMHASMARILDAYQNGEDERDCDDDYAPPGHSVMKKEKRSRRRPARSYQKVYRSY